MSKWFDIGPESDYLDQERQTLVVDDRKVLILRYDGLLIAMSNHCPHAGRPMEDGEIRNGVIVCPFHGNTYDLSTGRNIDQPHTEVPLRIYELRKTDGGHLEIELPDKVF